MNRLLANLDGTANGNGASSFGGIASINSYAIQNCCAMGSITSNETYCISTTAGGIVERNTASGTITGASGKTDANMQLEEFVILLNDYTAIRQRNGQFQVPSTMDICVY